MKTSKLLLPHGCLWVGFVLLAIGCVVWVLSENDILITWNTIRQRMGFTSQDLGNGLTTFSSEVNLLPTAAGILVILGGIMAGFSRLKQDDEYVEMIRFRSLVISFYLYAAFMLFALIRFWGLRFLMVMIYATVLMIIVYLLLFYLSVIYERNKLNHAAED